MYTYSVLWVVAIVTGASWALCGNHYRKPASCQEIFDEKGNCATKSGMYTLAHGVTLWWWWMD